MRLRLLTCWAMMVWAWIAIAPGAVAQAGMPGGNIGFNAAVGKLLEGVPAFSASVDTALTNQLDQSRITIPMRMSKKGDRLRIEVDFVKIRGAGVGLQGLAAMQNIGMARMVSLVTMRERSMLVMFPDLEAYTRVQLTEEDLQEAGYQVSKRGGSKETVNGQPCVRQQVTLSGPGGKKVEATTWEATALAAFPVRMYFKQKDGSMAMDFRDVNLSAPASELFEVPPKYRAFDSVPALMQDAMARVLPKAQGGTGR